MPDGQHSRCPGSSADRFLFNWSRLSNLVYSPFPFLVVQPMKVIVQLSGSFNAFSRHFRLKRPCSLSELMALAYLDYYKGALTCHWQTFLLCTPPLMGEISILRIIARKSCLQVPLTLTVSRARIWHQSALQEGPSIWSSASRLLQIPEPQHQFRSVLPHSRLNVNVQCRPLASSHAIQPM